jgi:hypothetical protein
MGRTSASHKASRGTERREAPRPFNETAYRRPSGPNADGVPTVRNLIPWRDMEKKLAERLAANAAAGELSGELQEPEHLAEPMLEELAEPMQEDLAEPMPASKRPLPPWKTELIEPAPDSGVRTSEGPARELTYSVYTVADLEARGRPLRMSMALAPTPPQPSRWADVGRSALAFGRAWWSWARAPKPRPRMLDVCAIPFQQLLTDAQVALRGLPWKKLAIGAGLAFGSSIVLLFLVLTAADLTDDLKPRRASSVDTSEPVLSAPVLSAPVLSNQLEAKPVEPPKAAEPEPAATIELDGDEPPPAEKPKPKKPVTKKKDVEVFIP